MKKAVKFTRGHKVYSKGDVAGFDSVQADKMIAAGVAVAYVAAASKSETLTVGVDMTGARAEIDRMTTELEKTSQDLGQRERELAQKAEALDQAQATIGSREAAVGKREAAVEKLEKAIEVQEFKLEDEAAPKGDAPSSTKVSRVPKQGTK